MRKSVFTVGDNQYTYIGYTQGERWKHYDVPYFEMDVAIKIAEEFNVCAEELIIYDDIYNNFYLYDEGNKEYEIWKGKEFKTTEGIKTLYGIGAWGWQWEEFTDREVDHLAEGIEDLLYEFDEQNRIVLKELRTQLKELKTLEQAIRIWYSDSLSAEEKYNALREELKCL